MTMKEIAKKIIASINPGNADISGVGDGTIKGAIRSMVLSLVDPMLATEEGFPADAKLTRDAIDELNSNLEYTFPNEEEYFTKEYEYFAISAKKIGNIVFARVVVSGDSSISANTFKRGGVLNKLKPDGHVNVKLTGSGSATASHTGHLIINPDSGNVAFTVTEAGKEYAASFVYFTTDF